MYIAAGTADHLPHDIYAQFARYRHQLFNERLGWQLHHDHGLEFDQFDTDRTLYVIAQAGQGKVIGGARLLPTTGPYLLADVFPQLLHGEPAPRSPDVWELSRFAAVDLEDAASAHGQFSSPVAVGLMQAAIDAASDRGARRLITVSPLGVERLLRRAGYAASRAGPPVLVAGHHLFACWIELP